MQVVINTETLKPIAEKIVARLANLGVLSKTGKPLVVDQGYEVVAAVLGHRNQHAMRAHLERAQQVPEELLDDASPATQCPLAQVLSDQYAQGDNWGAHPKFPREDWQYEVGQDDTLLGYWEWVAHKLSEAEDTDDSTEPPAVINRDTASSYRSSLKQLTHEELLDELKLQQLTVRGLCSVQQMQTILHDEYQRCMRQEAERSMWDFDFGEGATVIDTDGWSVAEMGNSTLLQRAVFLEMAQAPDADSQKVIFKVEVRAQQVVTATISD